LSELRYVRRENGQVRIGALTTIADLERQQENSAWCRVLKRVSETFGSPNIRSVATVGGNICAASSSEDLIPVFLVLDAKVKTIRKGETREQPLRDFLVAKRQTTLQTGEILAEVSFPETNDRSACAFQKLGIRNTLIIALVSVAAFLETDPDRSKIDCARIAMNRVKGKIPDRAEGAESVMLNRELNDGTIESAVLVLGKELSLTSDFRAQARYRNEAAMVLARRALAECKETLLRK
jgi:CO/xanthine dehydrogenase FAD-binding subunit